MIPRVAILVLFFPLFAAAQVNLQPALSLEPFVVTGTRPHAADTEDHDLIRNYDASDVESSGAFSVEEFLETLPRGRGDQQLVLIDGVPAYLDISALSPAMIAGIEVSYSGAMPAYGAYTNGRIVNIRLKQDYDGGELAVESGGSLHADGWRREVMPNGSVFRGAWKMIYSARYSRQLGVTADERDYSRDQDHRAAGGTDFRLPWGSPAVVQAVAGNLPGILDGDGNPVAVALVPAGTAGSLTPGDFLPGTGPIASGQRHFNTSPYLYLADPTESLGGVFQLSRKVGTTLVFSLTASYRTTRSRRAGPPPVSPASVATLVPAAFNPFGQDVTVGLVHVGFGPVVQQSDNDNLRLNLSTSWTGPKWRANARLGFTRDQSSRDTRDLDPDALTASLASADAHARFDPFVDPAGDAVNAALYPALAVHRTEDSANTGTQFNLFANGPVGAGWGAGPARLSLGGSAGWRENERTFRHLRGVADGFTRDRNASYASYVSAVLPLAREKPWRYRFEAGLNAAYSGNNSGSATQRGGVSLTWSPFRPWLLRANYGGSVSAPGKSDDDELVSVVETLLDPRRTPPATENVQVISRRAGSTRTSRGNESGLSVTYEPPGRPGLNVTLSYDQERQTGATGSPFNAQDVIDNEALFAGRVVRDTTAPGDLSLGQPGRILSVDTTATAVASQEKSNLEFEAEYRLPEKPSGRFLLGLETQYLLSSRYELADGQAFVSREGGPSNQPIWTGRGRVQWQRRQWSASVQIRRTGASQQGTIPAVTSVGLNVGYQFSAPVWRNFGKGLQLRVAVQNLGTDRPPYADTLLGYRGGSAVGTTVALTVRVPL